MDVSKCDHITLHGALICGIGRLNERGVKAHTMPALLTYLTYFAELLHWFLGDVRLFLEVFLFKLQKNIQKKPKLNFNL